jgi:hypothetical protein
MKFKDDEAHLNKRERYVTGYEVLDATAEEFIEIRDIVRTRHVALRGLTTDIELATPDQLEAIKKQEFRIARETVIVEKLLTQVVSYTPPELD